MVEGEERKQVSLSRIGISVLRVFRSGTRSRALLANKQAAIASGALEDECARLSAIDATRHLPTAGARESAFKENLDRERARAFFILARAQRPCLRGPRRKARLVENAVADGLRSGPLPTLRDRAASCWLGESLSLMFPLEKREREREKEREREREFGSLPVLWVRFADAGTKRLCWATTSRPRDCWARA